MEKLVSGLRKFQADIFGDTRALFERLVTTGQSPEVLFITCSDSRVVPNLVTQTDPGDLFVIRNAGNLVPPWPADGSGEAATIEYAVDVLGVKDIVICGHTHCGAMDATLHPEKTEKLPALRAWLRHADAARVAVETHYKHVAKDRLHVVCAEENVLAQVARLRTYPGVASRLREKTLTIHGWVYKIETGQVFQYDPVETQFTELGRLHAAAE